MTNEQEGKISTYNEALLKMMRINESQKTINELWVNPLKYIPELDKFGFEVIVSELFNLLSEVWGKLSSKEKKEVSKQRTEILDFLEEKSIFRFQTFFGVSSSHKVQMVFKENWKQLREILFDFQNYLKELYELHEMSTPNKEGEGDWD